MLTRVRILGHNREYGSRYTTRHGSVRDVSWGMRMCLRIGVSWGMRVCLRIGVSWGKKERLRVDVSWDCRVKIWKERSENKADWKEPIKEVTVRTAL